MRELPIGIRIEPCPVCGERVEYYNDHDGMLGCVSCGYGLVYVDEESLAIHNHISRVTRMAKEWDAGFLVEDKGYKWPPDWVKCVALHFAVNDIEPIKEAKG